MMIGLEILQRNLQRFDWWDRPSHDVANRMSDQLGIITTTNELQSKQRVGIQLIGIDTSICDALPIEALRICDQDEVANMMEYNKKHHHHHHNRNVGDGDGDDNNDNTSHSSPRRKLKKRRKKLKLSRQLINNDDDDDEVVQILEMKNNNNDGNYDNDNKGVGVKKKSNNDVDIVKSDDNNAKDGRVIVNNVVTSSNIVMANGKSEVKSLSTTAVAAVNKVVTNMMKMTRQKDTISSYDNNNKNNSNNRHIAAVVTAKQHKSMINKPVSLATYYDQSIEMKLQTAESPSTLCMSFTDDDDDNDNNYKGPSHGDEGVNTFIFVDEGGDVGDVDRVKTRPTYTITTTATTTNYTESMIKSVDGTLNDALSISSYDHDINNNVNGMIKDYSWLKQVSATTLTADNANNAVKVVNSASSIVKQSDSLRNNLNKNNRKDVNDVEDSNNNHTFVGNTNLKATTIRKEQINLVTLQLDDNIIDHDNMVNKTINRIQTPIRNRPKSAPSTNNNNNNNITATINNNDYHHHQSNQNQIFTSTKFNDFPQDNLRSIDPRENSPFGLSGIGYVHDNGIKNLKKTPNSWMNRVEDNIHDHDDGHDNNENHGGITIIKEQPQTKLLNKGITNRIKGSNHNNNNNNQANNNNNNNTIINNNNNKKDDNSRKIRVGNGRNMTFDEDSPQHIPIVTVELLTEYNHEEKKGEMNIDAIRYKKDSDVRFKVDVKKKKTRSSNDHPSDSNNNINNSNNTSATDRVRDKDINKESHDANAHNTTTTSITATATATINATSSDNTIDDTHGNNIQNHNNNNSSNSNNVKLSRIDQHKKIENSRSEKESKRKENLLLRELKRFGVDTNKVVI